MKHIIFSLFLFLITSCSIVNDTNKQLTHTLDSLGLDIYTAVTIESNNKYRDLYLKNGKKIKRMKKNEHILQVFSHLTDDYVLFGGKVMKNKTIITPSPIIDNKIENDKPLPVYRMGSSLHDIVFMYRFGAENGYNYAYYSISEKKAMPINSLFETKNFDPIYKMKIYDQDIYFCGYAKRDEFITDTNNGRYWVNNDSVFIVQGSDEIYDIVKHNDSLYLCGTIKKAIDEPFKSILNRDVTTHTNGYYWINNVKHSLSNNNNETSTYPVSMQVDKKGNIHIVGYEENLKSTNKTAQYWINGKNINLTNEDSEASAIEIVDGNIIIIGNMAEGTMKSNSAVVWINSIKHYIFKSKKSSFTSPYQQRLFAKKRK